MIDLPGIEMPTAVWSGTFRVYGVDVKCHTLSDGRRVIEADSFNALMAAMDRREGDAGELAAFLRWDRGQEG